jgi:hypothetical protein
MDTFKFADPALMAGGSSPVYFSPRTNKGVAGFLTSGSFETIFDVVHVTDSSGATAWFRYRTRTGASPINPFLIVPVVAAGVSHGTSVLNVFKLS